MKPKTRIILALTLVAAYCIQGWLVYTDPIASRAGALSPAAAHGKSLWQKNSCQSCHQLYGFGGFLGPDLTNAAEHHSPASLAALVQAGPAQMPRFSMNTQEIQDLYSYLLEISMTGRSPARAQKASLAEIPWFLF